MNFYQNLKVVKCEAYCFSTINPEEALRKLMLRYLFKNLENPEKY